MLERLDSIFPGYRPAPENSAWGQAAAQQWCASGKRGEASKDRGSVIPIRSADLIDVAGQPTAMARSYVSAV